MSSLLPMGKFHKNMEAEIMTMAEVKKIAKKWGVNTRSGRTKQDIIRDIQISEGYEPCFRTKEVCENDCLWKKDCMNVR